MEYPLGTGGLERGNKQARPFRAYDRSYEPQNRTYTPEPSYTSLFGDISGRIRDLSSTPRAAPGRVARKYSPSTSFQPIEPSGPSAAVGATSLPPSAREQDGIPQPRQQSSEKLKSIIMLLERSGTAESTREHTRARRVSPDADRDSLLIDFSDTRPTACGNFADVYTAVHRSSGCTLAMKMPRRNLLTEKILLRIEKKVREWIKLKHPNILPFLGVMEIMSHIYLVSPWRSRGDLLRFVRDRIEAMEERTPGSRGPFSGLYSKFNELKTIREIAAGLSHLHSKGLVHGNMKACNVLMDEQCRAQICDFGLTEILDHEIVSDWLRAATSIWWRSPEMLENSSPSRKSDVYAFGMTVSEVLSGNSPLAHLRAPADILRAVIVDGTRPAFEPLSRLGVDFQPLWDVAARCWEKNAVVRPSMIKILNILLALEATSRPTKGQLTAPDIVGRQPSGVEHTRWVQSLWGGPAAREQAMRAALQAVGTRGTDAQLPIVESRLAPNAGGVSRNLNLANLPPSPRSVVPGISSNFPLGVSFGGTSWRSQGAGKTVTAFSQKSSLDLGIEQQGSPRSRPNLELRRTSNRRDPEEQLGPFNVIPQDSRHLFPHRSDTPLPESSDISDLEPLDEPAVELPFVLKEPRLLSLPSPGDSSPEPESPQPLSSIQPPRLLPLPPTAQSSPEPDSPETLTKLRPPRWMALPSPVPSLSPQDPGSPTDWDADLKDGFAFVEEDYRDAIWLAKTLSSATPSRPSVQALESATHDPEHIATRPSTSGGYRGAQAQTRRVWGVGDDHHQD